MSRNLPMSLRSQTSLRTWTLGAHSMGRSPRRSRSRVTELLKPQSQARRPGLPSALIRPPQKQRDNSAQSRPRDLVGQADRTPFHRPHPRSAPILQAPEPPSTGKDPRNQVTAWNENPNPSSEPEPPPSSSNPSDDYYNKPQTQDTSSANLSRCLRCRATSGARCYTPVLSRPAFRPISVRSALRSL